MHNSLRNRTFGLGLLIILIGLVFLLRQIDFFSYDTERILFSWQTLLITIGLFFLVFGESKTAGFILIVVGGFFLMPEIFDLPYNFRKTFWPVLLILLGLFILSRSGLFGRKSGGPVIATTGEDFVYLEEVNVFSGSDRKISGVKLKGGKITSIFGGSDLDLTEAGLSDGINVIEVLYLFGGSSLTVPRDWNVINQVTTVLGGFTDKRSNLPQPGEIQQKTLIIRGVVIFGGGEIKSR
jgi:predicted membrane protein